VLLVAAVWVSACDEVIVVRNAVPSVEIEGWCTDADRTYLVVTVSDHESDPVDLSVCALDGAAMATGPTGDGLVGLTSEPGGRRHLIEWASGGGECACPREPATAGACIAPPAGRMAPTVELLVGDGANFLRPQGNQPVEPLDACR